MNFFRALGFLPSNPSAGSPDDAAPLILRDKHGRALIRRRVDGTQRWRRLTQWAFLALNGWIGVQFYLWVRHYESAGQAPLVTRPPGVEGWLPIAALMNLKYWLLTWEVPRVHAAGMFLLLAFVSMSWLLRKAFCSWLCPIGTLSEVLWEGGRAMVGRNIAPPRWLDIPLRGLKYLLLSFFLYAVATMSAASIRTFLESPYGLVADVKMLDFFRHLGQTGAIVIGILIVASVFVQNAWCRYLCPYGALLGLVALVSPTRIRRNADACIDCAKCAKACPSRLPVDQLPGIRSAECTNCLLCITACPSRDALASSALGRRIVPGWVVGGSVVGIFLVAVIVARVAGHWHTNLPDELLFRLIPIASQFGHP